MYHYRFSCRECCRQTSDWMNLLQWGHHFQHHYPTLKCACWNRRLGWRWRFHPKRESCLQIIVRLCDTAALRSRSWRKVSACGKEYHNSEGLGVMSEIGWDRPDSDWHDLMIDYILGSLCWNWFTNRICSMEDMNIFWWIYDYHHSYVASVNCFPLNFSRHTEACS